jgi:hypothetical protein
MYASETGSHYGAHTSAKQPSHEAASVGRGRQRLRYGIEWGFVHGRPPLAW